MPQLTKDERGALHQALMEAYPERGDLDNLLQLRLGETPALVAADRTRQDKAILDAINFFESRSRIVEFVNAAAAARPQDRLLAAIAQTIQQRLNGAAGKPPAGGPPAGGPPAGKPPAGKPPVAKPPVAKPPAGGAGSTGQDHGGGADDDGDGDGGGGKAPTGGLLKVLVAFAILAIAAVLVLVFTRSTLTAAQWGVAKPVLAIACAFFALFIPGALNVTIGSWLKAAGPIAVFVIVFFFTPPPPAESTMTVSGYIQYVGGTAPVANAVVVYPQNNLRSNPTPADGYFTLNGVPTGTTDFRLEAGGKVYALKIEKPSGESYPIVARDPKPVDATPIALPASNWAAVKRITCPGNTPGQKGAAFKLTSSAASNAFGPILLFRVISTDDKTRLAQVLEVKPDDAASVSTPDPTHQREWEVSAVPTTGVSLGVTLCLTRDDKQPPNAQGLRFEYRYRRME